MNRGDEQIENLTAYLDGELSAAERAEVERLLERDEQARKLLADLRQTARLVGSLPRERLPVAVGEAIHAQLERESLLGGTGGRTEPVGGVMRWARPVAIAASVALACSATYLGMGELQKYREQRAFTTLAKPPVAKRGAADQDGEKDALAKSTPNESPAPEQQLGASRRVGERFGRAEVADRSLALKGDEVRNNLMPATGRNTPEAAAKPPVAISPGGTAVQVGGRRQAAPIYGEEAAGLAVDSDARAEVCKVVLEVDARQRGEVDAQIQSALASAHVPEAVLPVESVQATSRRWFRREASHVVRRSDAERREDDGNEDGALTLNVESNLALEILASLEKGGQRSPRAWSVNGRSAVGGEAAWTALVASEMQRHPPVEAESLNASAPKGSTLGGSNAASPSSSGSGRTAIKKVESTGTRPEFIRFVLRVVSTPASVTTQGAPGG